MLSWFMFQYSEMFEILSPIGSKIVGKGASILGGLAKILNETMKG